MLIKVPGSDALYSAASEEVCEIGWWMRLVENRP